MKNSRSPLNFGHTDLSFCTPSKVHKNEQLLFSEQKKLQAKPNNFQTLAGHSSIAEMFAGPPKGTEMTIDLSPEL